MLFLEKKSWQSRLRGQANIFVLFTVKQDYLSTECESCEQEYEWLVQMIS
jgi:hypothetical protein